MTSTWPEFESEINSEDLDALDKIEAELNAAAVTSFGGYTSPLMARLGTQRLTVDMLAAEIPRLRAASEAEEALAAGIRGSRKQRDAQEAIAEGERAKERLFGAALPLIRTVASREWRRRQQWGSQVTLEDLTQEAIVGFFKGLSGFKPEAVRRSATNYLGQWMLVEMRRSAEVMDHDLQVGHDAGERYRRVRALRSRLTTELGREPTDQEISDASRNPEYVTRPGMVGRAPQAGESPHVGKGLTPEQVAEEKATRSRLGHSARFVTSTKDSSEVGIIDADRVEVSSSSGLADTLSQDPADLAVEADTSRVIATIVAQVIERMKMPGQQREIISRRFGLAPYEEEASAREISRVMGVHRERVTRILAAFTQEMTRRGGTFHEIVGTIPEDDLLALGLGWVSETLGPWDKKYANTGQIPGILVEPAVAAAKVEERATGTTDADGVLAWFRCDYHDRLFTCLYLDLRSVPRERSCPVCQKPSELVKTAANQKQ